MTRFDGLFHQPRKLTLGDGELTLPSSVELSLVGAAGASKPSAWQRLRGVLAKRGFQIQEKSEKGATIEVTVGDESLPPQGYLLTIEDRVTLRARDAAGFFYGVITLEELMVSKGPGVASLPRARLEDWPDFPDRGVMLDVSRDKVPTLETLLDLVELFGRFKLNQLQLYVEHTFAYAGHEKVWGQSSPLTADDIQRLDAACRERHIELVPNQNSFGHLHRWLAHEPYRQLAEAPEGFEHPWNPTKEPFSLCAVDPKSIEFMAKLYDELLPNFSSGQINVGCDETIDLGLGRSKEACEKLGTERVYLDYVKKIHELVTARGKKMQFWGDIIIKKPELIPELPKDAIALEWGYEADHPFAEHLAQFAKAGLEFYVCPGTSSWNTIGGRTENMLGNIQNAVRAGKEHGARGVLNTDWGDNGHLQPLSVSYLGFAVGALLSWNAATPVDDREHLGALLDWHVFGGAEGLGVLAFDLGNAYREAGRRPQNNSALFQMLLWPKDAKLFKGVTLEHLERTAQYLSELEGRLENVSGGNRESELARMELLWATVALQFAARLAAARLRQGLDQAPSELPTAERQRFAAELTALLEGHRDTWLRRNRPGGLDDSARRLEKVRAELAT